MSGGGAIIVCFFFVFVDVFFVHFVNSNFALFCLTESPKLKFAVSRSFFTISVRFFLGLWLAGILASCCASCSVFLFLFTNYFTIFIFISPLFGFVHFFGT